MFVFVIFQYDFIRLGKQSMNSADETVIYIWRLYFSSHINILFQDKQRTFWKIMKIKNIAGIFV